MARTVKVTLDADEKPYVRGVERAEKATDKLQDSLDDATGSAKETAAGMGKAKESIGRVEGSARAAGRGLGDLRQDAARLDKQIDETSRSVRELARAIAATSDEADRAKLTEKLMGERRTQRDLVDLRKLIDVDKAGRDVAEGVSLSFSQRIGPLLARMPIGPHMAAAMAAAAPAAVAVLAAAISGGVAVAGVGAGVALAARSPEVKQAAAGLSAFIGQELTDAAKPFVPATLQAIETVRQGFADLRPEFEGIFADAAPFLQTLTEGAVGGLRALVPALRDVMRNAEPVVDVIGDHLAKAGAAAGAALRLMTQDSQYTAQQLDQLFSVMEDGIVIVGGLVAGINKFGQAKDDFLKKLGPVGGAIQTALNPLGPAISKLGELGRALGDDAEEAEKARAATAALAAGYQSAAEQAAAITAAFDASNARLTSAKIAADAQTASLKLLRDEMARIAETNISAAEASLNYRDSLNEAKNAADGHKKVSADEERQLLSLARSSNTLTGALQEQGASTGELSKHTSTARANFIATARQMGYTKTQAEQLAAKFLNFPPEVSTPFSAPGLAGVDSQSAGLKARLRAMDGTVVDITFKYGFVGGDPRAFHNRMGGVYEHAQSGLINLRQAATFTPMAPARYAFAEPATGGEAFIPKNGNPDRSLAILERAASWYGAMVTKPGASVVNHNQFIINAAPGQSVRAIAEEVARIQGRQAGIYARTG